MLPSRVYAEINLDAMCSNVSQALERMKPAKLMAIIKTDAYGHGAVRSAKALDEIGVYAFGVATPGEALELRRAEIKNPILILGYVFEEYFDRMIENDIDLALFDLNTAKLLNSHAEKLGKKARVHIKADTGMGRIGFQPCDESAEIIKEIAALNNIEIDGMFTHFACADSKDKASVNRQIERFTNFVAKVKSEGVSLPIVHCYNSASIVDFDKPLFDMVRCGIITYGLEPSDEVSKTNIKLQKVMSIKSHVAYVKKVGAGFTVSYGSTYVTDKETEIATIPVGYGDGYPRTLSNKGMVLIGGHFAKIIGRVCMDQFMVDVTGLGVSRGDEVILMGSDGENSITAEEIGDLSGRFNYELVCDINKRVPRVYIKNGEIIAVDDALEMH
ncbi:MAG: alanine racemase [Oscillospiraceae bacterium]|nr:alanine racemase [Ruminococcus sp.]MDY6062040.1 alanine racemase [Oscillospiraceae bacterium]